MQNLSSQEGLTLIGCGCLSSAEVKSLSIFVSFISTMLRLVVSKKATLDVFCAVEECPMSTPKTLNFISN